MKEVLDSFLENAYRELAAVPLKKLLVFMIIAAIIVHISVIIYTRYKNTKISILDEIMAIAFCCYVGFILAVCIFSRRPDSHAAVVQIKHLWIEEKVEQNVTNLLNIILFIPFSVLLSIIGDKSRKFMKCIIIICLTFLMGLFIEVFNYMTRRSYFEIDNIEANILGSIIGFLTVLVLSKMFGKKEKVVTTLENVEKQENEE